MAERLKVLIVEDHRMVAESLAQTVREVHQIVGIAYSGGDALRLSTEECPDVILLDLSLGHESGFDLVPELRRRAPKAAILILTIFNEPGFQSKARELGIPGFISKMESTDGLFRAITSVSHGETWYSDAERVLECVSSRLDSSVHLTARQVRLLHEVAGGLSYKQIGKAMGLTENTIDVYLRRIHRLLGGHNVVDLVRLGLQHGFISPESVEASMILSPIAPPLSTEISRLGR